METNTTLIFIRTCSLLLPDVNELFHCFPFDRVCQICASKNDGGRAGGGCCGAGGYSWEVTTGIQVQVWSNSLPVCLHCPITLKAKSPKCPQFCHKKPHLQQPRQVMVYDILLQKYAAFSASHQTMCSLSLHCCLKLDGILMAWGGVGVGWGRH